MERLEEVSDRVDRDSTYGSESGSPTELQNEVESAYGIACGSNTELQNNVEEKQENIENNAQLLKYLEKSNGILKKFYTVLKK